MKEQIKNIIESYCEGINHLEFNIADLDKMADEILTVQLQQTGVVGRSEQLCVHEPTKTIIPNLYNETQCKKCGEIL